MRFNAEIDYFEAMASVRKSYARMLEPICQEWKLTRNELDILLFLHNNPEFDRAADIVSRRGIAKSHVSLSVASLEEKGLLRRSFSQRDRRTVHLSLTDRGNDIAGLARERQVRYLSALFRGVSREEVEIWRNIAQKVRGNITELGKTDLAMTE